MKILFDYNRTLFNPDTGDLYPGVFRVLKTLSARHALFLITLDKPERKDSAAIADLRPYFTEVKFVERKSAAIFQELVGNTDQKVIVIGDRLEDEIRIGIKLGYITIHLPNGPFSAAAGKIRPAHRATSITKVLEIIATYEQ